MIQPQTRVFTFRGVEHALVPVSLAVVPAHRVPLLRAKLLARCPFAVIFGTKKNRFLLLVKSTQITKLIN